MPEPTKTEEVTEREDVLDSTDSSILGRNEAIQEAEERQCRYCLGCSDADIDGGAFVAPCACTGGQRWVHLQCLRRWQRSALVTQPTHPAFYSDDKWMSHCGVCTQRFTVPPIPRHELMLGFTGAELAALVQEQSLICASENWSNSLRARLHVQTTRSSISGFVHWCQGTYLIYYSGPKQLVLSIPDESNRVAVIEALGTSHLLTIKDRQYRVLPEGPLADLRTSAAARCPFAPSVEGSTNLRRGAEWVQSALCASNESAESTPCLQAASLVSALVRLPLPSEVTLEALDQPDASDDSIRAVNLSNRIAPGDLSHDAQLAVQAALRKAKLPRSALSAIQLEHHLGGPCTPSHCVVLLPLGEPDGAVPPLPSGFKVFGQLGFAAGTDLSVALRALAGQRRGEEGPPRKRPRFGEATEGMQQGQTAEQRLECDKQKIKNGRQEDNEDALSVASEASAASAGSDDPWGVNIGELVDCNLAAASSGDESEDVAPIGANLDAHDMIVGLAAEGLMADAGNRRPEDTAQLSVRPLKVFWGEARWQRTQLLGELARGDWGLCQARASDLCGGGLWARVFEEQRPVLAPPSEMSRETDSLSRALGRLVEAHQEARRQQDPAPAEAA